MIDVRETKNQDIVVKEPTEYERIILENVKEQSIRVSGKTEIEEILIQNSFPTQKITVGIPQNTNSDFAIALDSKVPKSLSVLTPIVDNQFNNVSARQSSKIYVDVDSSPRYATIEQIKQLNTKTIYVDKLSDGRISALSDEDIILLKED